MATIRGEASFSPVPRMAHAPAPPPLPTREPGGRQAASESKAAVAPGSRLFPSRTEKLSPGAPMVLRRAGEQGAATFRGCVHRQHRWTHPLFFYARPEASGHRRSRRRVDRASASIPAVSTSCALIMPHFHLVAGIQPSCPDENHPMLYPLAYDLLPVWLRCFLYWGGMVRLWRETLVRDGC